MGRRAKANSLNLHHSREKDDDLEEEKISPFMYLSSHQRKPVYQEVQHRSPIMNPEVKMHRPAPKSESKHVHTSNEKTARSNSIDCKSKPLLYVKMDNSSPDIPSEHLDHSRVIRMFNQEEKEPVVDRYDNSIIYD